MRAVGFPIVRAIRTALVDVMRIRTLLLLPLLFAACDDEPKGDGPVGPMDAGFLDIDMQPTDAGMDLDEGAGGTGGGGGEDAAVMTDDADLNDAFERDYDLPDAAPSVCREIPEQPVQMPIDLGARCRRGDGPLRIRDVRDSRCPDWERLPTGQPGREETLREAIVTGVFGTNFTVSDPEGGAYAAVYVFNPGEYPLPAGLQRGTIISVRGQFIEFFTQTELVIDEDAIEIIGNADPIEPILVADPQRIATGGDLAEALESVLLEVQGVTVSNTAPDCPRDFGMFVVTGGLRIDDKNDFDYEAKRNDFVNSVVGVLHYSFDQTKLFPRDANDIDITYCGGVPDKCETSECQVELDTPETGRLVISEIQTNPRGEDTEREWIEIYNPGGGRVDLAGWTVEDCSGRGVNLGGRVDDRAHHVIARSQDRELNGGVRSDGGMGELFLPNSYGSVLLFNPDHQLVDQVRYEPEMPWPDRFPGQSLELINTNADNNAGANWRAGDDEYGDGGSGTPGR
jgi:hypothetical protein